MGIADLEFWGLTRMTQRIGNAAAALDLRDVGFPRIRRDATDKLDVRREVGFTHFFQGGDWRGTHALDSLSVSERGERATVGAH